MRRVLAAVFGLVSLTSASIKSSSCGHPDAVSATGHGDAGVEVAQVAATDPEPPRRKIGCAGADGTLAAPWLVVDDGDSPLWACQVGTDRAEIFRVSERDEPVSLGVMQTSSFAGLCSKRVHEALEPFHGGACLTMDFIDDGCADATGSREQRRVCLPPRGEKGAGTPIDFVLAYVDNAWVEVSTAECDARKLALGDAAPSADPNLCFDVETRSGAGTVTEPSEGVLCYAPADCQKIAYRVTPGAFERADFDALCRSAGSL